MVVILEEDLNMGAVLMNEVVPMVPETLVSGISNSPIDSATHVGVAASSRPRD